MSTILRSAVLSLAISGAVLALAQPVQAGGNCATVSATAAGLFKATTTKRAEIKLKWAIHRWARKAGVRTVHTGKTKTWCGKGAILPYRCTASAYVCK